VGFSLLWAFLRWASSSPSARLPGASTPLERVTARSARRRCSLLPLQGYADSASAGAGVHHGHVLCPGGEDLRRQRGWGSAPRGRPPRAPLVGPDPTALSRGSPFTTGPKASEPRGAPARRTGDRFGPVNALLLVLLRACSRSRSTRDTGPRHRDSRSALVRPRTSASPSRVAGRDRGPLPATSRSPLPTPSAPGAFQGRGLRLHPHPGRELQLRHRLRLGLGAPGLRLREGLPARTGTASPRSSSPPPPASRATTSPGTRRTCSGRSASRRTSSSTRIRTRPTTGPGNHTFPGPVPRGAGQVLRLRERLDLGLAPLPHQAVR
jgi:hypothetical protein